MSLVVFLAWAGGLLIGAIALAFVVKNLAEGFAVTGRKPFAYGFIAAFLTSGVAFLTSYKSAVPFELFWYLGGIFLLFGIIHIWFTHNRYFYAYKFNSDKILLAEVLFGLSVILFTIMIFVSVQYIQMRWFPNGKDFLFYPILMSTLLFFVPLLFFHSFQAAYQIPAPTFPTWQYPFNKLIELPKENPKEKILVIGFRIAKRATDSRKTYFRVMAPETWKLADLFYHFINEHNELHNETNIEYADNEYEPYEWWFVKQTKWYQPHKILNPEFSIRENGIKENTVVICERISSAIPVSNTVQ